MKAPSKPFGRVAAALQRHKLDALPGLGLFQRFFFLAVFGQRLHGGFGRGVRFGLLFGGHRARFVHQRLGRADFGRDLTGRNIQRLAL